jgi:hypothetical protein
MPTMSKRGHPDLRVDAHTSARVNEALRILGSNGISAALEFMQLVAVPRGVAWRVLCSPTQCRKRQPGSVPR